MHIGIIHTGDSFGTDFPSLLRTLDTTISVSSFHHTDKTLLHRLSCLQDSLDGLIITGSVYRIKNITDDFLPRNLMDLGVPILGICYGFQWMTWNKRGEVHTFSDGTLHEYNKKLDVFAPFTLPTKVYTFSHHDYIYRLPSSWKPIIKNGDQIWMAYEPSTGHIGIQFHPERHKASAEAFFKAWFVWIKKQKRKIYVYAGKPTRFRPRPRPAP